MRNAATLPELPGVELIEEIGRGAHAVVYRASRGHFELAVKMQREATGSPQDAVRFRREAAVLACMRHQGLPIILEVGDYEGRPYLVMDYAAGRTLSQVLADGPLQQAQIVSLARDLAGALGEVHGHGLVHRDVKPDNVLLTPDGDARLLDFGLATRVQDESDSSEVAGTFLYAAPEQTGMLKRPVDGRSDLYALGVLLFECATGKPPFTARDAGELVRQHAVKPVPDILALRPDLSPVLARIITRLLAKDPDDRYLSGRGLLADLLHLEELEAEGEAAVLASRDGVQVLFEVPVVGRDVELDLLAECWLGAREGQGGAVLVEGPAGLGKSRLLREVVARVRGEADLLVLQARCSRSDPAPFGPLREAVEGWLRRIRQLPPAARAAAEAKAVQAAGEFAPLLHRFSPGLAAILPEAPSGAGVTEAQDPFYTAVARFLVGLAGAHGAALLCIDDVEWLDDASRQVLRRLVGMLADSRMLFVAAGCDSEAGLKQFVADAGDELALRLPVRPLDDEATATLVAHLLGVTEVPADLARAVVNRAQGAPFAVVEYVSAMLDAGLLLPDWGGWRVDTDGLEKLALPSDVADLIARRVLALSASSRPVLRGAAVWGSGFTRDDLLALAPAAPAAVDAALGEAQRAHLIEAAGDARFGFVHDRVRSALLDELDADEKAALHRAIAERLASREGAAAVFAVARHRALGGSDPGLVYEANLAAGKLALQAHANDDAGDFLETARQAAARAGIGEGVELAEALGAAAARAGRFSDAVEHLERALAQTREPPVRARLHTRLASVRLSLVDTEEAWRQIEAGFRALRRPYPTGSVASWAISLALAAVGTVLHLLGVGYGGSARRDREEHALLAQLSNLGSRLGYLDGRVDLMVQMTMVPLYSIHRLGPSRELVGAYTAQALLVSRWRLRRLANFLSRRALAVAASLDDRVLAGRARVGQAQAHHIRGEVAEAEALHRQNLDANGAWLEAGDFLHASSDLAQNLLLRGNAEEAWRVLEEALYRADGAENSQGHPLPLTAAVVLAQLGRIGEAKSWLQRGGTPAAGAPMERWRSSAWITGQVAVLLEQGELGKPLEEALERHRALGFSPSRAPFHLRLFWLLQAHARLEQVRRGAPVEKLERALAELRAAAHSPVLKAHAEVVGAGLAAARGQARFAAMRLAEAEAAARSLDAPWVLLESLLLRARAGRGRERREVALRDARLALALASQLGWSGRARAIAREFALAGMPSMSVSDTGTHSERGSPGMLKLERQLAALLQVSRACASVLHPDRVAEVALDEIVRILGAERAILFLGQGEGEPLVRKAARAAAGCAPGDPDAYSKTVVQRVWNARQPLVVSSVEEEANLGAQSVVAHELRSIMAVPLLVRDTPMGVVYVDNRLARGMFGRDDVQILAALASHIATALETARAVQLEIERNALESDLEKAFHQATTDALTGLRNRRFLEERLVDELARARRTGRPFSVLLLDVDRFKGVNDTHGHLVGDQVLAGVGGVLAATARSTDLAARYGGEEFCVVAPDTEVDGARVLAERIREEIGRLEFPLESGEVLRVTASLGVAQYALHGWERTALFDAADQALYAAKEGGRNQVRLAAPLGADAA